MKKEDFVQEICELLDIRSFHVTAGSSVPTEFFNKIIDFFSLPTGGSMPERAKRIVEAAQLNWKEDFDSTATPSGGGGTVTAKGLDAVHRAVTILLENKSRFGKPYDFVDIEKDINQGIVKAEYELLDKDAATKEHFEIQNQFAEWLIKQGITPRSPYGSDPKFDLGFEYKNQRYVVEVKSITKDNESDQLRYALGQVLEYAFILKARPIILTSQKIINPIWKQVLNINNVLLIDTDFIKLIIDEIIIYND